MANVQKYTRGATGNMANHYERKIKEDGTYVKFGNQDINPERTNLNYNLAPDRDISQVDFIEKRLSEVRCMNRADVNVMCSWVVTLPKDEHIEYNGKTLAELEKEVRQTPFLEYGGENLEYVFAREECEEKFFQSSYDFLEERYGKENVISAYVHKDEIQPHMHFSFIPVVKDKKRGDLKVSAKEVLTREELQAFHREYSEHLEMDIFYFKFRVVNEATIDGNKTVTELKRATELEKQSQLLSETTEIDARIASMRMEGQEVVNALKNQANEIRSEINGLLAQKDEVVQDLNIVQNALKKETVFFAQERGFSMDSVKSKIAEIKQEHQKELRYNLFEQFLNHFPKVRELFDQFVQAVMRSKNKNHNRSEMER